MLDKSSKIKQIQDLGSGNYLITLKSPEQARLVQPGQFVMIKCCGDVNGNPLLRRPFSIFALHRNARTGRPIGLEILVKNVGEGTRRLAEVKPGQQLRTLGPQGRPFPLPEEMRNRVHTACLVAGGVGIAALYLLARRLIDLNVSPILFYGGRTAADLVLREYFDRLGMETYYATEDGSLGERGLVTLPLGRYLKEHSRQGRRLYACGPWAMMRAVNTLAIQHGVPCEVSLEARMGCSLGACMGCVVRGRNERGEKQYFRVCTEGPVVNSMTVDWDMPPI